MTSVIDSILKSKLTKEQYEAAIDTSNCILCLACAGSGKSRTLAFRIARLIDEGNAPDNIVAFTFTEKAADSIKRRVAEALGEAGIPTAIVGAMYIGTIHSYCKVLLGEMDAKYRQFEVLDENGLKLYLISRYAQLGLNNLRTYKAASYFETINEVSNAWKTSNEELLSFDEIESNEPVLGKILKDLKTNLERDHFIDFSLMIRLAVEALHNNSPRMTNALKHFKHLMVDEYQDVNPLQEKLIQGLHAKSESLFVVGDDDQAIYGWRGADVKNILSFDRRYSNVKTHILSENFRSTQAIVESSDTFIQTELSASRFTKTPYSHSSGNIQDYRNLWFDSRQDEANWVADRIAALLGTKYVEKDGTERGLTPGDFAILMRSIKRSWNQNNLPPKHHEFTEALKQRGILYTMESEGGIFDRQHANVVRGTFELLRNAAPQRQIVIDHFTQNILPVFPNADRDVLIDVITNWNIKIHSPIAPGAPRRKVYPQDFLHDLLNAFGVHKSPLDETVWRDLGVFSKIILDIEKIFVSIDSPYRYGDVLNFIGNVAQSGYELSNSDLIIRPDAVTISTIHKMKGLEFPCVFIVDVVNRRFPGDNSSYSGWLPSVLMQAAIARGAYGSTRFDEARLFYTAMTRAERFLYVTGAASQPDTKTAKKPSVFKTRLTHPDILTTETGLPINHTTATPTKRFNETEMPTSFTEIKDYLACPMRYKFRKILSFSPPVPELFGYGLTTHTAINKIHQEFQNKIPTGAEAEQITKDIFHLKHLFPSKDPVNSPGPYENALNSSSRIVKKYVEDYSSDFNQKRQLEVDFDIKASKALITGSIDLLLKEDSQGKILDAMVIDFKSMEHPSAQDVFFWIDLSLQVQLYAHASKIVLGENAKTGAVHLLKEIQDRTKSRIEIPIHDDAIKAAIENIEWAVDRILNNDFPKRPSTKKCEECDFHKICSKSIENFKVTNTPPEVFIPDANTKKIAVRAFSDIV